MEFGDYTKGRKDKNGNPIKQLNVLALVGNGFDIQALGDLGVRGDTQYESFYYFLKSRNFNEENCIFRVMEDCKEKGLEDWSDVEAAIQKLVNGEFEYCMKGNEVDSDKLKQHLSEIQSDFSEFLNQVVTSKVLDDLSDLVQGNDKGERGNLVAVAREVLEDDYKRKCFLVFYYLKELLGCEEDCEQNWLKKIMCLLEGFELPERYKWRREILDAKGNKTTKNKLLKDLEVLLPKAGDYKWDWGLNDLQENFCAGSKLHPLLDDLKKTLCSDGYERDWQSGNIENLLWEVDNRKPLTLISFQNFLQDLSGQEYGRTRMKKKGIIKHCDIFNFHFINFNYTFLFDNYIYLDQKQFEPECYKSSDNNITFHTDFYYTYQMRLVTHAPIHPHGIQTIPRSILFGIDTDSTDSTDKKKRYFAKPYWAQNEDKYGPLIEGADYFIIFGTSLGETDRWWWESIINRIKNAKKYKKHVEVFLYWYKKESDDTRDKVLKHFATVAGYEEDKRVMELLENHVRVVIYNNERKERVWLNTNPQKVPVWVDRKQDWKET